MKFLAIVFLCIASAIVYGVLHDLVTAHICVEYFTIGHPPVFHTDDPVWLALGWGVIATWWVGLMLGVPMGLVSTVGPMPGMNLRRLMKGLFVLLCTMGVIAGFAGILGYVAASLHWVVLLGALAERVPAGRHVVFLTDLWMHLASYASGFIGGIVLCVWIWRQRRREGLLNANATPIS